MKLYPKAAGLYTCKRAILRKIGKNSGTVKVSGVFPAYLRILIHTDLKKPGLGRRMTLA